MDIVGVTVEVFDVFADEVRSVSDDTSTMVGLPLPYQFIVKSTVAILPWRSYAFVSPFGWVSVISIGRLALIDCMP